MEEKEMVLEKVSKKCLNTANYILECKTVPDSDFAGEVKSLVESSVIIERFLKERKS